MLSDLTIYLDRSRIITRPLRWGRLRCSDYVLPVWFCVERTVGMLKLTSIRPSGCHLSSAIRAIGERSIIFSTDGYCSEGVNDRLSSKYAPPGLVHD